jgi:hypothetical protein
MIAARIARRQESQPAARFDLIGFLLFYRLDWCEQRPGLMLAIAGALIVAEGVAEQLL